MVTVTLGNASDLAKYYRLLALQLAMQNGSGQFLNINEDYSTVTGNYTSDWVVLTMDNGSVSMFPKGTGGGATMTVVVRSIFYISYAMPYGDWTDGSASPELFCEVAHR